jgi:XTP/dITP diphosphohydrolase
LDKLIVATSNPFKLREIKALLGSAFEIVSLKDCGITIDIPETGETFYDNALIKAKTIFKMTQQPVLAEDSGLEVFALNGSPGVKSARFAGEPCNDVNNNLKLLEAMRDCKNRDARYVSVIVVYLSKNEIISFSGDTHGKILKKTLGQEGFGYDPLFLSNHYSGTKTFAQLTFDEKLKISHRSNALEQFLGYWNSKNNN